MAPFTLVGKLQGFAFNSERLEDGGFHADIFVGMGIKRSFSSNFIPVVFSFQLRDGKIQWDIYGWRAIFAGAILFPCV